MQNVALRVGACIGSYTQDRECFYNHRGCKTPRSCFSVYKMKCIACIKRDWFHCSLLNGIKFIWLFVLLGSVWLLEYLNPMWLAFPAARLCLLHSLILEPHSPLYSLPLLILTAYLQILQPLPNHLASHSFWMLAHSPAIFQLAETLNKACSQDETYQDRWELIIPWLRNYTSINRNHTKFRVFHRTYGQTSFPSSI